MAQFEFVLKTEQDGCEEPYVEKLGKFGKGDYIPEGGPGGNFVHVFEYATGREVAVATARSLAERAGLTVTGVLTVEEWEALGR